MMLDQIGDDIEIFDTIKFKFYFSIMLLICFAGYAYEIFIIGFLPIFQAIDDGFFDNLAGFLSFIHYFSTSLGAFSGVSLAFVFITKTSRLFYLFLFLISFLGVISLLTKNILFITIFFFIGIMNFYNKLNTKRILLFVFFSLFLLLLSSAIRTGSSEYIQQYSQIHNNNLPPFFHWFNTYFAVNITHFNTYYANEYTSTYGFKSIRLITSLLLLKDEVGKLFIDNIIYYNGLGGNINVHPLIFTYYSDFNIFSFIPMFILGLISGFINKVYLLRKSFSYAVLYSGFMYILGLSVFADYLNRLMIPIAILFIIAPYYISMIKIKIR